MEHHIDEVDILAFGAHPDDVEIGMGGTLAKYAAEGYKVGICDLTKAELSSNGTVEQRQEEAKKAAEILGLTRRIQLEFPDRGLTGDSEQLSQVVSVLRKYQPKLVFVPYEIDRHPDHGQCARIVKEAVFNAGIRKYIDSLTLPPHRVKQVFHYMINGFDRPSFIIDISEYMSVKEASLHAYESQFSKTEQSVDTPLTNGYIETVQSREKLFGKMVSVQFGEGFIQNEPLLIHDLLGERK
ncbi:bacillithiol biosynthesis deacetylase BshB1 [Bacillus sp. FJAT-45350]|uniref:bacillithiol biosynthesis deacetylase BshB1 n=1 Tax=Bacillus sp. FJAT-45350 TaxID=2011014 RepID=UPI000BB847A6|nr:bacillithiol biosynthesis deacetylase BshB1 [Bacillus sp. FJAT-45350]